MILVMHGPESMCFRWLDLEKYQFSGRQGKSASCGPAHVVGGIEEFQPQSIVTGWRFRPFPQGFQRSKRHHPPNSSRWQR